MDHLAHLAETEATAAMNEDTTANQEETIMTDAIKINDGEDCRHPVRAHFQAIRDQGQADVDYYKQVDADAVRFGDGISGSQLRRFVRGELLVRAADAALAVIDAALADPDE